MKVEIISIGAELLNNQILNTNAAHVVRALREVSLPVAFRVTVGDLLEDIVSAIRVGLARSSVVLTVGGLGDHPEDITRRAAAEATGRLLSESGRQIQGATELGGAGVGSEGLILEQQGALLVCLPGRPRDMVYLLETEVLPALQRRQPRATPSDWIILRTAGLVESTLSDMLANLDLAPGQRVTYASYAGQTDIRLWAEASTDAALAASLDGLAGQVARQLGDHVYGRAADRLEQTVLRQQATAGATLALVECYTNRALGRLLATADKTAVVHSLDLAPDQLAERYGLPPPDDEGIAQPLTRWCRLAAERLRDAMGVDLTLVLYRHVRPGGVELLVTLASAHGVSIMQRAFGGHPANIDDWAVTLGLVHLRRWLLAHAA